MNILGNSPSQINRKQSELESNMELVYILAVCIKGSNIVIKMQINIVEISHNCNRMSSSYDFTSLYSITLSSCCVLAAALLGDTNIWLQNLSNQIKFLLYFLQITFEKKYCFRAEPEHNCFNNSKEKLQVLAIVVVLWCFENVLKY